MKIPGIVYSLLLAVGAWAIDYFTQGNGAGIPWAPILVAAVPIILKTFTVQAENPTVSTSSTRGMATDEPKGRMQEWLLG